MQRIDFYQAEFRPVKVVLPFSQILKILLGVSALLVIVAVTQHFALKSMTKEFNAVETLTRIHKERAAQLTADVAAMRVQPALEAQLKSMRSDITNQERLLVLLKQQSSSHTVSFSNYLQGLMDHHLEGISLNTLEIGQAGSFLRIEGNAAGPELLPRYIEGLKQADALQGLGFSVFDLKRSAVNSSVQFELSSKENDPEKTP